MTPRPPCSPASGTSPRARVGRLDERLSALRAQAAALRREDVSRQADAVREAADGRYARMLSDFVETQRDTGGTATASRRRHGAGRAPGREATLAQLRDLSDRSMRTRDRVEAIGQVPAIGLLLVNQRESLPDVMQYRRQLARDDADARAVQARCSTSTNNGDSSRTWTRRWPTP